MGWNPWNLEYLISEKLYACEPTCSPRGSDLLEEYLRSRSISKLMRIDDLISIQQRQASHGQTTADIMSFADGPS
jgi:hypothetical protein